MGRGHNFFGEDDEVSESQEESPFRDNAREFARYIIPLLRDREFIEQTLTPWLTVGQAAAYLGINNRSLRSFIERGVIPYHRPSHRMIRFRRDELDLWVREHGRPDVDA